MPTRRETEAVIAMWREIERALVRTEPGSLEFERLTSDAALLRDEYQRLLAQAKAQEHADQSAYPEPGAT